MTVVWEIETDGVEPYMVTAASNEVMVTELLARGFNRLLKDDIPYQDEPLAMIDSKGREWSAMPAFFSSVKALPSNLIEAMSKTLSVSP